VADFCHTLGMAENKTKAGGVARSSKTGRFVKKSYAKRHPNTTVYQTVAKLEKNRVAQVVRDRATGKFVAKSKVEDILEASDIIIETVKR
jgi:hypothetical protein